MHRNLTSTTMGFFSFSKFLGRRHQSITNYEDYGPPPSYHERNDHPSSSDSKGPCSWNSDLKDFFPSEPDSKAPFSSGSNSKAPPPLTTPQGLSEEEVLRVLTSVLNALLEVDSYILSRKYDTVFLIDDSGSMEGSRWAEAGRTLEEVARLAAKYDPNGIDIHFLNAVNAGRTGIQVRQHIYIPWPRHSHGDHSRKMRWWDYLRM